NGVFGGSILVKDSGGTGWATQSGSNVVRYDDTAGTTLPRTTTLSSTTNYTTLGSGSSVTLNSATTTANSLAVDTTNGTQSINLGTGSLSMTNNGLLFRGSNDATISNGTLNNTDLTISQLGTGKLTLSAGVQSTTTTSSFIKDGTGELVLTNTNKMG